MEKEKIEKLIKLAEQGDMQSKYQLAMEYLEGESENRNHSEGLKLLSITSASSALGQKMLGYYLVTGEKGDKDVTRGIELLQMAAQSDNEACKMLGGIYYAGISLKRDAEIANMWFALANMEKSELKLMKRKLLVGRLLFIVGGWLSSKKA
jgi:TPR repeat protein